MAEDEQIETFKDIARICVKKPQKGLFDELITSLYRIKQLTEFIPLIKDSWDNKTVLMKCISQGLKYKNFLDFKKEVSAYESFSDLADCNTLKAFYSLLLAEEVKEPIQKKLLKRFQLVLHDHEYSLSFLKNWVTKEIEELEKESAPVTASQASH